MTESAEDYSLEAEVGQLEEKLEASREATRRVSRTYLGYVLALCGVAVIFLLVNYFKIKSELTPENFSVNVERQLREVGPAAFREFSKLGEQLLPIYVAEWKRQFSAAWPQIARKANQEMDCLGENLKTRLTAVLTETENRVLEQTEKALFDSYPELRTPQQQQELSRRLHAICDRVLEQSLLDFDASFSKDVARIQEVVITFDVSDGDESTVDLQKKFLRLWLQLLDQEIMKI